MSEPAGIGDPPGGPGPSARWTAALVYYLRFMAGISLIKGLYHWGLVLGIGDGEGSTFERSPVAWQSATIFFAVVDLIAGVGLWLAAAWGGVVWLTSAISLSAIQIFFPQVYGGQLWTILAALAMVLVYMGLALAAARERPD